jgi:SAM-dependent methyltransferase
MDKKTQTLHTYNQSASAMAEKFNTLGPRIKDITRAFSYLQKDNPKVLELGCGNGRDAAEILKHTSNYVGIDYSQPLLDIARQQTPGGMFELADIEDYTFPSGLDIVFSFASLLHSDKGAVRIILDRAYEALVPGGVFFISLKYAPYREETLTDAWGTRTFYLYTPEDIKEQAGEKWNVVYESVHDTKLLWQKWFEIILQK